MLCSTSPCYIISHFELIRLMSSLVDHFALLFAEFYPSDFMLWGLFFFFQFIQINFNFEPVLQSAYPLFSFMLSANLYILSVH